jgi:hypothetical protein
MKKIFKQGYLSVNGVDVSDHVREVHVTTARDEQDTTSIASANKERLYGLGDATIAVVAFQDFEAGEIDAVMWPLSTSDTPFVVAARARNTAISATNPEYRLDEALLGDYNPIDAAAGETMMTPLTFANAGTAGLVRDVTP